MTKAKWAQRIEGELTGQDCRDANAWQTCAVGEFLHGDIQSVDVELRDEVRTPEFSWLLSLGSEFDFHIRHLRRLQIEEAQYLKRTPAELRGMARTLQHVRADIQYRRAELRRVLEAIGQRDRAAIRAELADLRA